MQTEAHIAARSHALYTRSQNERSIYECLRGVILDLMEYLNQIKTLQIKIDRLMVKYTRKKEQISSPASVSYDKVRVQEGRKNKIEEGFLTLAELSEKIFVYTFELVEIKHRTVRMINQLEDPHEIEFLFLYYVLLKTMAAAAKEMNLTERMLYRIKKRGLQNLNEIYINAGVEN